MQTRIMTVISVDPPSSFFSSKPLPDPLSDDSSSGGEVTVGAFVGAEWLGTLDGIVEGSKVGFKVG